MKRTKKIKKVDLILTSDWHLRETTPPCRTDNFWETQWGKVEMVSNLQHQHDCPVLHAGDLFHHWKPSPYLLSYAIAWLPDKFYTVYGQHDLPQHNWDNREKSGINVLTLNHNVYQLSGAHWGEKPEEPSKIIDYMIDDEDKSVLQRRILVWHRMVWQGERLWPGQTDPSAYAVLKKYSDYDLILTGDNHKPFTEEYEGRLLVNPGSLTRQSADQIEHTPRVYLYYAATNSVRAVFLPISEGEEAISRDHIDRKEKRNESISAFISKLGGKWKAGMSFSDNLEAFFQTNKVRKSTKAIIYKAIDNG